MKNLELCAVLAVLEDCKTNKLKGLDRYTSGLTLEEEKEVEKIYWGLERLPKELEKKAEEFPPKTWREMIKTHKIDLYEETFDLSAEKTVKEWREIIAQVMEKQYSYWEVVDWTDYENPQWGQDFKVLLRAAKEKHLERAAQALLTAGVINAG